MHGQCLLCYLLLAACFLGIHSYLPSLPTTPATVTSSTTALFISSLAKTLNDRILMENAERIGRKEQELLGSKTPIQVKTNTHTHTHTHTNTHRWTKATQKRLLSKLTVSSVAHAEQRAAKNQALDLLYKRY